MYRFFVIIFLILNLITYSQQIQPEIEITKEKIILNGKIYYLHTIKSGQTLYSISKAYNVSLEEILTANPGLNPHQIKEGTSIKIPLKIEDNNNNNNSNNENNFILHKVKQGETLYFLSKKYNVPIDYITKNNPGLETLKIDQIIKIPKNVNNIKNDTIKYIIYELNKKDTLYNIAKKYNTSIAEIIELNPELKNGIKKGLKIKIPLEKKDTSKYNNIIEEEIDCNKTPEEKKLIKYAILIPKISYNSEINNTEKINKIYKFYNFYKGILIALDSIKNEGKTVNLKIFEFDQNNRLKNLENLISFNPDVIINFEVEIDSTFLSFPELNHKLIISPIETEIKMLNSLNIIEIIKRDFFYEYLFDYLSKDFNNKKLNIIIIEDIDKKFYKDPLTLINKYNVNNNPNFKLKIFNVNDSISYYVNKNIDSTNNNVIFINSSNEGMVSILLSRLNILSKKYDINVVGIPEWLYFNKIEIEVLHKLNTKILSSLYIDYNDKNTSKFLYKNVNLFGYEPPKNNFVDILTFLGFDVMLLSENIIKSYINYKCFSEQYYTGLLGTYYLEKDSNNLIVNKSYSVISYEKDYTIKRIIKNISKKFQYVKK